MEVTEHNVDCDWKDSELEALMALVMREIKREGNDTFTQLFYGKIYGKLMGMKHGLNYD